MRRIATLIAGLLTAGTLLTATMPLPAHAAALNCASDPFEVANESFGLGAPIAVGQSVTRAICQDRDAGVDRDWFYFDAVGGKAYSAAITAAGSKLAFGQLNGLEIAGVFKAEADGSWTTIQAANATSYERFTTPVLAAGRYAFLTVDGDEVGYPDFYLGTKPVDGAAGVYTVKLTEAPAAPSLVSITAPALRANKNSTGTYTLSGPAPVGGMYLFMGSTTGGYISVPKVTVPAGATRGSYVINVGRFVNSQVVTIVGRAEVGGTVSVNTTVKP